MSVPGASSASAGWRAPLTSCTPKCPDFHHEIRWRPFFLNPDTPPTGEPYLPFLVQKFGSQAQVEGIWQRIRDIGAPLGINYRFEKIQVRANTLAAHRLIHWAQQQGDAAGLVEGLFKAQFEQGENVGDHEVLAQVATTCGHDPATVLAYLDTDKDAATVQQMERESRSWGVSSVPTFVFARQSGIQGAEEPRGAGGWNPAGVGCAGGVRRDLGARGLGRVFGLS